MFNLKIRGTGNGIGTFAKSCQSERVISAVR